MKKLIILLTGLILISSCKSVVIKDMRDETGFVIYSIMDIGENNYAQYGIVIVNGGKNDGRKSFIKGAIGLSVGDTLIFKKKDNFRKELFGYPFRVTYIRKGNDGYHYSMTKETIPGISFKEIYFTSKTRYKIGDTLVLQKK